MLVIYWWIWFGLCITDLFPVNASQQTEIPQPLDLELHYLKMVVKVKKNVQIGQCVFTLFENGWGGIARYLRKWLTSKASVFWVQEFHD